MNHLLLGAVVLVPLLAAVGALLPSARPVVARSLPFLPLPALLAAVAVPASTELTTTWLLFGGHWSLDATRTTLLAAMSLVWCIGGWHVLVAADTRDRVSSLVLPWTAALTGNMWVAVAQDVGGFYSGFALLSFAAYGLLVQRETPDASSARAAGRLYLVFTVLGEMAILGGLLLASHDGSGDQLAGVARAITTGTQPVLISALLVLGFGVKCALLGMHFWLPTVYTTAPAPVRVVLGGAMINAGVLGWLVTLPIGSSVASSMALPLVLVGLAAAFGAAIVGVWQSRAATVLAYSSISQMGLITVLVGVALAAVGMRTELIAAIAVFAAHHGLTKGALFLSADAVESAPAHWPLFVWPALVLAGLPFTSGALSKLMTKHAVYAVGWDWLSPWLTVAALGTTVLMGRALWCAMQQRAVGDAVASSATTRVAVVATLLVAAAVAWLPRDAAGSIGAGGGEPLALLWPIVAGVVVSGVAWRWRAGSVTGSVAAAVSMQFETPIGAAFRRRTADAIAHVAGALLVTSRTFARAVVTRLASLADPEQCEVWVRRHASFSFVLLMLVLLAALL